MRVSIKETYEICDKICKQHPECLNCPMKGNCFGLAESDKEKIFKICEEWKSNTYRNC